MSNSKFIHKVPSFVYHVDFSKAHAAAGSPSVVSISQATNISRPTIAGYIQKGGVDVENLNNAVIVLAAFLGVDWQDYVTAEEITEERDDLPETQRTLLSTA